MSSNRVLLRKLMNRFLYRKWQVPYPLRAMRFDVSFGPFTFWWKPYFFHRKSLTEQARVDGAIIWYAHWLFFRISYSRWL